MEKKIDIRPSEKYALSAEEAAVYFHIGINRLRTIIKANPDAKWLFRCGSHTYIKKEMFSKLMDNLDTV